MKKLFVAALVVLGFSACNGSKDEEKTALNEVINIHDKVMSNDEQLMQNKMKLDTLLHADKLPVTDTLTEKVLIRAFIAKLAKADGAMESWMQKFDPAQTGKSHAEIMAYLADQKKQVLSVDSQLTVAVKASGEYINHLKK